MLVALGRHGDVAGDPEIDVGAARRLSTLGRMQFGDEWTVDQRDLARIVYEVWRAHGRWPLYSYVERRFYQSGYRSAREVLYSFPVVGQVSVSTPYYSDVTFARAMSGPTPETPVQLSVSGLLRLADDGTDLPVSGFLKLLEHAALTVMADEPKPFEVGRVTITDDSFAGSMGFREHPETVAALYSLLSSEPFLVTGLIGGGFNNPSWIIEAAPWCAQFASGVNALDYVARVVAALDRAPKPQPRVLPSPLSLHESLHYLDITWQLHCARPLVQVSDPARMAALAFDAKTADEVSARLTALADLLKSLQTHSTAGVSGHALQRLDAYLGAGLSDEADREAATASIAVLRNVSVARDAFQHAAAASRGLEAWLSLGLSYPPTDWNEAWLQIRGAASDALLSLRVAVEKLPRGGCQQH